MCFGDLILSVSNYADSYPDNTTYFSIPIIFPCFTVLHQLFSDPFLQFPVIPHFFAPFDMTLLVFWFFLHFSFT